jgi:SET domain/CXC domain
MEVIDLTGEDTHEESRVELHRRKTAEPAQQSEQPSIPRTKPASVTRYNSDSFERAESQILLRMPHLPSHIPPEQPSHSEANDRNRVDRDLDRRFHTGISSELQSAYLGLPDFVKGSIPPSARFLGSTEENESVASRQTVSSLLQGTESQDRKLSEDKPWNEGELQNWAPGKGRPLSASGLTESAKNARESHSKIQTNQNPIRPRLKLNGPKRDFSSPQHLMPAHHTTAYAKALQYRHDNQSDTSNHGRRSKGNEAEQTYSTESDSDDASVRMQRSIHQVSAIYRKEPQEDAVTQEISTEQQGNQDESQTSEEEGGPTHEQSRPACALGSPELGERISAAHDSDNVDLASESLSKIEKNVATLGSQSEERSALDTISRIADPSVVESFKQATADDDLPLRLTNYQTLDDNAHSVNGRRNVSPDMRLLEAIFKPMVEEMRADQEYLVSGILSRARKEAMERPGPELDDSLPDPFAAAGTISTAQPAPFNPLRRVRIESRVVNARSKALPIESQAIAFNSEAERLPKYHSIVRLGSNILAQNDKDLRYDPYFPSEEEKDGADTAKHKRREELLEGFDNRIKFLPEERRCAEQAEFWREHVEYFLEEVGCTCVDVMFYLLHDEDAQWKPECQLSEEALLQWQKREVCCSTCGTKFEGDHWDRLSVTLSEQKPDEETLALAGLSCSVFSNIAKFSIWHIVSTDAAVQSLLHETEKKWATKQEPKGPQSESLCMVCHIFDCPTHGAYLEDGSHCGSEGRSSSAHQDTDHDSSSESTDKPDHSYNIRQTVALSRRRNIQKQEHRCGFYCMETQTRCVDILSRHASGEIKGNYNKATTKESGDPGFADEKTCSQSCFWDSGNRPEGTVAEIVQCEPLERFIDWCQKDLTFYSAMLATCIQVRRGPCIMASMLARSCAEIFREMLIDIHIVPHPLSEADTGKSQTSLSALTNGYKDKNYWFESSQTYDHHKRSPFVPCSHSGACHKNSDCTCWTNKVACEWICGCNRACSRRFQGCRCIARGAKVCFKDSNCDCWVLNRECDPWLCGKCGVLEILDPVNRHDDSVLKGRCKNAMIQRNIPKRTLKGTSEVHGWGLFAGTDIRANDFIGEYKGEVISEEESNRRGLVYHYRGLEYLFRLNKDQEIDSSRAGNKMRFINNSERPGTINVYAQTMLCNGVQRIGLFAKRNIVAGEELFFRYGYPESVTKNFWEKEDVEAGRYNNKGEDVDDGEGGEEKRTKVKRGGAVVLAAKEKTKKGISKQVKKAVQKPGGTEERHAHFLDDILSNDDEPESIISNPPLPKLRLSGPKKRKRTSSPVIEETTFDLPDGEEPTKASSNPEGEEDPAAAGPPSSIVGTHTEIAESDTDDEEYEDDDENQDDDDDDDEEPSASAADTDASFDEDDEDVFHIGTSGHVGAFRASALSSSSKRRTSKSQRMRNLQKTAAARTANLERWRLRREAEGDGDGGGNSEAKANTRAVKTVKRTAPATGVINSAISARPGASAGPTAATTTTTTTSSVGTPSSTPSRNSANRKKEREKQTESKTGKSSGPKGTGTGKARGRPPGWKKGVDFQVRT